MKILLAVFITLLTAIGASAETFWNPTPPSSPGTQAFTFGAETWADDESGWVSITLYKNGVYLASQGGEGSASVETTTTAGWHTTLGALGSDYIIMVINQDTQSPSVPTGVAAINKTSSSFTLTWSPSTDNSGVTGYEVKRDSTLLGTEPGASRNINGLQPGGTYQFSVRATDGYGNWSGWSVPWTIVLDNTPPTTPGNFTSTGHTDTSVALSWSASTDDNAIAAYDVYRTRAGITNLVGSTGPSTNSFADIHVLPGTAYTYHVKARDDSGNSSSPSSTVAVTTDAASDADADGIPDVVDALFGTQSSASPNSDLTLKPHRPHL